MTRSLRSILACTLVLGTALLAACSDSPTGGARDDSSTDASVQAANNNVAGSGTVSKIGRSERSVKKVVTSTSLNALGRNPMGVLPVNGAPIYLDRPCDLRGATPSTVTTSSESGELETSAGIYPLYPTDPCEPNPCDYDPDCGVGGDDPCTINPASCNPCYPNVCPPSPTAGFNYGSDATPVSFIPNTTLKTLRLVSFSQAVSNVSFTSLNASFKNVGAQTSCYNTPGQFDSSYASGSNSPLYLEASREPAWQGVIRWQVDGTHSFTAAAGATGGGTFYSSDFTCG